MGLTYNHNKTVFRRGNKLGKIPKIAISSLIFAAVGIGIGGTVYYHNLQNARADAITAISENKKSIGLLQNSIDASKDTSRYQEKDIMPDDKGMIVNMKDAERNADTDYSSSLYMKDINDMQLGEVKAFANTIRTDTSRKDTEAKMLNIVSTSMKKSHQKRVVSDTQSSLNNTIQQAKQKLQASNGNVDDNTARVKLQSLIDSASKLTSGNDVNAMNTSLKGINDTIGVVESNVQSRASRIAQEQQAAAALAAQQQQQAAAIQASSRSSSTASRSYNRTTGKYSSNRSTGNSAANSTVNINAASACNGDTSSDACQEYVDRGGFVNISYYNGGSNVYAAHRGLGGRTVLGWQVGQKVNINGRTYTVTNKRYNVADNDVPKSGTYAQTCNTDGGRVLVGLQ
jgi:hypothetical protein